MHIESMLGWNDKCARCFSILPVLSHDFLLSKDCYEASRNLSLVARAALTPPLLSLAP